MSWFGFFYPHRRSESRFDPRTKLMTLFGMAILVVCLDRPISLMLLAAAALFVFVTAQPSKSFWLYFVPTILIGIWAMIIGQGLFYAAYPRTPLVILIDKETPFWGPLTGGIALYREGMRYGLVQSLRMSIMLAFGLWVGLTTEPRDLLNGLLACRIPSTYAFLLTAALRFVPTVAGEAKEVMFIQHVRGIRFRLSRPLQSMFALFDLFKPILVRNVRRAGLVADAIETRGFASRIEKYTWRNSSLFPLQFKWWDYTLMAIVTALVISVSGAKLINLFYMLGITQAEWMRLVSGFSIHYL